MLWLCRVAKRMGEEKFPHNAFSPKEHSSHCDPVSAFFHPRRRSPREHTTSASGANSIACSRSCSCARASERQRPRARGRSCDCPRACPTGARARALRRARVRGSRAARGARRRCCRRRRTSAHAAARMRGPERAAWSRARAGFGVVCVPASAHARCFCAARRICRCGRRRCRRRAHRHARARFRVGWHYAWG